MKRKAWGGPEEPEQGGKVILGRQRKEEVEENARPVIMMNMSKGIYRWVVKK